ncbi:glycosyltransferase family 2 protein [[Bacillus] enclensis]|uniref:glycosyltransferase family 2 protein n=1 Tax=[Bacillus] enclensis TaxID=1402860 RepID=UPI0018DCFB0F|nr:glycosyltransferase family 2 protein [[Bacillus] enclensis]MBH9967911.1 glycosyltransferase family 2 protein [[Bacillus] enclensis]
MISVLILTYNEEKNIKQCLKSLTDFSDDIYILDSYSDDKTVEISQSFLDSNRIMFRKFDNYSKQRNWALQNIPYKYEWLLMIDADEVLTKEVKESIKNNINNPQNNDVVGFVGKYRMYFLDKLLRYKLWPFKKKILFRHKEVKFERDINEYVEVINKNRVKWKTLDGFLLHKDNKSIHDYLAKHNHYSTMEAFRILEERKDPIDWKNIRKITEIKKLFYRLPFRNLAYFIYLYILRLGFLDGRTGFEFILTRINYQFDIDIKMKEIRSRKIEKDDYISFRK